MIIDFHTHIFPPFLSEHREDYLPQDLTLSTLFKDSTKPMASASDLISEMDASGVDKAVVLGMGWTNSYLALKVNDYLLEMASLHKGRLIPFCSVNPAWGKAATREVERCARLGARGIGELHPDSQGFNLSSTEVMDPFMEVARQHHLILLIHGSEPVGHQYPGKGATKPEFLMSFIQRYQDIPIVCAHWGGGLPFYGLMPEVRKAMGNTYFDSAASTLLYHPQVFSIATKLVGVEKVLFGSDYPLLSPGHLIKQLTKQHVAEVEQRAILGENAARLLGLSNY
jgi:predicted TIM-barrel fold metal-dependent hydrolase